MAESVNFISRSLVTADMEPGWATEPYGPLRTGPVDSIAPRRNGAYASITARGTGTRSVFRAWDDLGRGPR